MNDELLLRMLQDASANLSGVRFPTETPHVVPVYNGLLAALKANYPNEAYLQSLPLIEGGAGPEELRVLLGQLRVLLEVRLATNQPEQALPTQRLGGVS